MQHILVWHVYKFRRKWQLKLTDITLSFSYSPKIQALCLLAFTSAEKNHQRKALFKISDLFRAFFMVVSFFRSKLNVTRGDMFYCFAMQKRLFRVRHSAGQETRHTTMFLVASKEMYTFLELRAVSINQNHICFLNLLFNCDVLSIQCKDRWFRTRAIQIFIL